ncbi:MAG: thioredoxin reductase [Blastocatellia bacterium]|nr:thioredoxin reductase [Blastocatellia bacterium]
MVNEMAIEDSKFDLIIIGAGPSGISSADTAAREGLNYLVLEKGLIANTVYNYPVGRTVFSTVDELEMREGQLLPAREKPTREELLSHYVRFVLNEELNIHTEEEVLSVEKLSDDLFIVRTTRAEYAASRIIFAVGAMAHPRELGVPGEHLSKVHHRFVDPYPFVKKHVMVVGGGNSAAEAALFLSEEGAYTTLTIWRSDWDNRDPKKGAIKHWVRTPLEHEIAEGRLQVLLFDELTEITETNVYVRTEDGPIVIVPNDDLFILIGAEADLTLLRNLGVQIVKAGIDEIPVYDEETFQTNVQGVYVAGHFTLARHIKEAILVPRRIVPIIARELRMRDAILNTAQ